MFDLCVTNTLNDHGYELRAIIGSGGYAECYEVFSSQYQEHFVCKTISLLGTNSNAKKRSFEKELIALSTMTHPNIVKIYQTFQTDSHLFLILEYCKNGDMDKFIRYRGPIKDTRKLFNFVHGILCALCFIEERGIAHKDIKPSNILLDTYGRPKLADFGLAEFTDKNKLCEDYNGSLVFVAPEVLSQKPYDPMKADIWSFGVTLYFFCTSRYPFACNEREALKKAIRAGTFDIPRNMNKTMRKLITGCIQTIPENRTSFSKMKEIIEQEIMQPIPIIRRLTAPALIKPSRIMASMSLNHSRRANSGLTNKFTKSHKLISEF
jgi:serine/threonine protein kinase